MLTMMTTTLMKIAGASSLPLFGVVNPSAANPPIETEEEEERGGEEEEEMGRTEQIAEISHALTRPQLPEDQSRGVKSNLILIWLSSTSWSSSISSSSPLS